MESGAHQYDSKERTIDVSLAKGVPFSKMMLNDYVVKGLTQAGFINPTIIQANAIRVGKSGVDLLIQSKSGTGKTITFCVILLETYKSDVQDVQSLIITPTREVAVQIETVLNEVGKCTPGFRAISVIGGQDIANDRRKIQGAKAIIGTPGRILHLINSKILNITQIKLFIIDEVDKMLSYNFRNDLNDIRSKLLNVKQTIACSATFPPNFKQKISGYMPAPVFITAHQNEHPSTVLLGVKQFFYEIPEEKTSMMEMTAKLKTLKQIFSKISFKQCLLFSGSQSRAESYQHAMEIDGWSCELITGLQSQSTRLEIFKKFRNFQTRMLFTTDLMARGVDSEYVNLVVNLELPDSCDTYLHRIGRAGRFGSHGIAVSFISSQSDHNTFNKICEATNNKRTLLKFPTVDAIRDFWDFSDIDKDAEIFGVFESKKFEFSENSDENDVTDDEIQNAKPDRDYDNRTYNIENSNETGDMNQQPSSVNSALYLPSSNTIDDASSIAIDSDILQSSQLDLIEENSNKVMENKEHAFPSLLRYLIDPQTAKTNFNLWDNVEKKLINDKKHNIFSEYDNLRDQSSTISQDTQAVVEKTTYTINDQIPFENSEFSSHAINDHLHLPSPVNEPIEIKLKPSETEEVSSPTISGRINAYVDDVDDIEEDDDVYGIYDDDDDENDENDDEIILRAVDLAIRNGEDEDEDEDEVISSSFSVSGSSSHHGSSISSDHQSSPSSSSSYYTSGFDENTASSCSSGIHVTEEKDDDQYSSSINSDDEYYWDEKTNSDDEEFSDYTDEFNDTDTDTDSNDDDDDNDDDEYKTDDAMKECNPIADNKDYDGDEEENSSECYSESDNDSSNTNKKSRTTKMKSENNAAHDSTISPDDILHPPYATWRNILHAQVAYLQRYVLLYKTPVSQNHLFP